MKLYSFTLTLVTLMLPAILFAQAPLKINYQAVARDASGNIIANQNIGLRTSILEGSTTGPGSLVETHVATTNDFGLFNIQIGGGTYVSGSTIEWNTHEYFIQVELDIAGGTNYILMGVSQLVSVPYAMHSNTAENVINDAVDDADADPTNEIELPAGGTEGQTLKIVGGELTWIDEGCGLAIGDTYQGGIIFYLDESGCHGYMCAPVDQSTSMPFRQATSSSAFVGCRGDGLGAGKLNTSAIIAEYAGLDGFTCAGRVCATYELTNGSDTYGDWYLPSLYELNLMYENIGQGDALGLGNVGNFAFNLYWSSIESGTSDEAYRFYFVTGAPSLFDKQSNAYVRAVRAF